MSQTELGLGDRGPSPPFLLEAFGLLTHFAGPDMVLETNSTRRAAHLQGWSLVVQGGMQLHVKLACDHLTFFFFHV